MANTLYGERELRKRSPFAEKGTLRKVMLV
jgi:hypothetical protein